MEAYSSTKKSHPLMETTLETMEGWLQGIYWQLDEKTAGMRQRGLTLAETAGKYIALPVVFFVSIALFGKQEETGLWLNSQKTGSTPSVSLPRRNLVNL